jgi:hypothetical protein
MGAHFKLEYSIKKEHRFRCSFFMLFALLRAFSSFVANDLFLLTGFIEKRFEKQ